ncbi:MAG TPA: porin family protein [Chitinophagaceae bacterium]|nr:porin family protein [Chitinophagaceae bacterium]
MKQKALFFSLALLLLIAVDTRAQKSSTILRAGVNFANVTITNDGDIDKNSVLTSYQVGVMGDFHILSVLSLQTGVLFTGKGSKTESGDPNGNTYNRATSNPWYIEIPLYAVLKSPTGPIKFFAGAGPYIAIGIAGKNKVDGKFLGSSFQSEKDIRWSNDDPSTLDYEEGSGYGIMKRFDYGLNGMLGLQVTKLVVSLNYGLGLAKLQSGSNSSADDQNKHRVLSLIVGLRL